MAEWNPKLEKVLSDLTEIKKQAQKADCIHHTTKMLRDWADRIEAGEIAEWELEILPEYTGMDTWIPASHPCFSQLTTKFTVKERIKK